nr:PREDICTED: endonuclease domain-containing 1 protein-like [Anolis carolinensis]|eukprot:XP_016849641.1 PREDICTED: endonuclease domain-containing 1 protein-like [Anolis carolinensis]
MFLSFLPLLVACFPIPGKGEVVEDFSNCLEFFLDQKPPGESLTPVDDARICQFYKKAYRFATMYDKDQRVPIYSAYKCKPGHGSETERWMIEPQPSGFIDYKYLLDYKRGYLSPVVHQPDEDSRVAASTLTNAVPLYTGLEYSWRNYQNGIQESAGKAHVCHDLYVISGAVPSRDAYVFSNRVNQPSHIWSAACCVHEKRGRTSWAAIAKNKENKVKQCSLDELQVLLTRLYGKGDVDLFNNACNTNRAAHRRRCLWSQKLGSFSKRCGTR